MRSLPAALVCVALAAQDRSSEKEAALGRQMAEEVLRSTTPVEAQAVQDYVGHLGAKFSPSALRFTVVTADRPLHEPAVLPGGYIFVPVKLLLRANDEAEFAGMLAQAVVRGPLRTESHGGTIPVVIFEGFYGSNVFPAAVRNDRRKAELRADVAAVPLLAGAGFDPAGLLRYIERMQPGDAARIAALREAIRELPAAAYPASDEFYRIQEQARSAPENPRAPPSLLRPAQ